MSKQVQLMFFEETCEEKLMNEIKDLRESINRIRKGQFAKIGELNRLYLETKHELETLKHAICRNKIGYI